MPNQIRREGGGDTRFNTSARGGGGEPPPLALTSAQTHAVPRRAELRTPGGWFLLIPSCVSLIRDQTLLPDRLAQSDS